MVSRSSVHPTARAVTAMRHSATRNHDHTGSSLTFRMRLRMFDRSARSYCPSDSVEPLTMSIAIVSYGAFLHVWPWPPWPCNTGRLGPYLRGPGGLLKLVIGPLYPSHHSLTMPSYRIERHTHMNNTATSSWAARSERKETSVRW